LIIDIAWSKSAPAVPGLHRQPLTPPQHTLNQRYQTGLLDKHPDTVLLPTESGLWDISDPINIDYSTSQQTQPIYYYVIPLPTTSPCCIQCTSNTHTVQQCVATSSAHADVTPASLLVHTVMRCNFGPDQCLSKAWWTLDAWIKWGSLADPGCAQHQDSMHNTTIAAPTIASSTRESSRPSIAAAAAGVQSVKQWCDSKWSGLKAWHPLV